MIIVRLPCNVELNLFRFLCRSLSYWRPPGCPRSVGRQDWPDASTYHLFYVQQSGIWSICSWQKTATLPMCRLIIQRRNIKTTIRLKFSNVHNSMLRAVVVFMIHKKCCKNIFENVMIYINSTIFPEGILFWYGLVFVVFFIPGGSVAQMSLA